MSGPLVLVDPWWDLRGGGETEERQRSAIQQELLTEIAAGHPLAGLSFDVVARSEASDEVLVMLAAGRWALVHPTWRRAPEPPHWPRVRFYDSVQALEQALGDE